MQPTPAAKTEAKKNGPANAPGKPGAPATQAKAPFSGEGTDTTDVEKDEAEKRPEIPREEKRKLFDAVFAAEKDVEAAEKTVAAAMEKRSVAVRHLIKLCGNGPWRVNGQVLRASSRGDTAFLKRPGDENIEEV